MLPYSTSYSANSWRRTRRLITLSSIIFFIQKFTNIDNFSNDKGSMRHPWKTGATKIEKAEQRLSVARQVEIRFFGKICWDDQQSIIIRIRTTIHWKNSLWKKTYSSILLDQYVRKSLFLSGVEIELLASTRVHHDDTTTERRTSRLFEREEGRSDDRHGERTKNKVLNMSK